MYCVMCLLTHVSFTLTFLFCSSDALFYMTVCTYMSCLEYENLFSLCSAAVSLITLILTLPNVRFKEIKCKIKEKAAIERFFYLIVAQELRENQSCDI